MNATKSKPIVMMLGLKKATRRGLEWVKLMVESAQDAHRYYRAASWAGPGGRHRMTHIEADLIKGYHVLEKGLAMAAHRPRAGADVLRNLLATARLWKDSGGDESAFHYRAARAVIRAYEEKHRSLGVDVSDLIPPSLLEGLPADLPAGGWRPPTEVAVDVLAHYDRIALSRHSVRHFDPERIPDRGAVTAAVRVATSTPSVCNRQTWRVHFYEGTEAQRILSHQTGNRGFGHLIPMVAVVTSDMRLFASGLERYQAWIEGGMFGMNFILALHARGISSVVLNWSRLNKDDRQFRAAAGIPGHERIAMLIGCGYAAPGHEVTCSPRAPFEGFITWHPGAEA